MMKVMYNHQTFLQKLAVTAIFALHTVMSRGGGRPKKKTVSRAKGFFEKMKFRDKQRQHKPFKRRQYYRYRERSGLVNDILEAWSEGKQHNIRALSRESGIPETTLRRWFKKWRDSSEFDPLEYSAKGAFHRIFSDFEERNIATFIRNNIIAQGYLFTNDDFRTVVMAAFLEKHNNEGTDVPHFNASDGFIDDFKKTHGFTSRKPHYKRRSPSKPEFVEAWKKEMEGVLESVPRSHILNCDETSWKLYPNGLLTWADCGSQNVQIRIDGDEKMSITALATIGCDGVKWPLFILAKGKTNRVETSQLGDISGHMSDHSRSGWMTVETFKHYLSKLRELADHEEPLHLVCDVYPAHRTPEVRQHAEQLNIVMHFIPAGLTDKWQPLDCKVSGCMKATARRVFRTAHPVGLSAARVTKQQATQALIYAWEHLQTTVVEDAWSMYTEEEEEDE